MNTKTYTCIIIDDNSLDRQAVEQEVLNYADLKCIGSFENCVEALSFFNVAKPDIVFVDVDMPEITGLEFIKTINQSDTINIIISSYPEYALQGFELKVFDFILKPLESDRFNDCIKRLTEFFILKQKAHSYDILFENENIIFKEGHTTIRLNINEIIYLEAFGDYTKIVTEKKVYLTLTSLTSFQESLPGPKFMRIHRSYVIAINKVQCFKIKTMDMGNNQLPVGKTYLREAKQAFKLN